MIGIIKLWGAATEAAAAFFLTKKDVKITRCFLFLFFCSLQPEAGAAIMMSKWSVEEVNALAFVSLSCWAKIEIHGLMDVGNRGEVLFSN